MNWNGHVRATAGYSSNRVTLFVASGLAIANFDAANGSVVGSQTELGLTIGTGAQFEVHKGWDVRVEFLHDVYRDLTPKGGYTDNDWSDNIVRAAAIYRFGAG